VARGAISEADLAWALDAQVSSGERLGRLLLAHGAVDRRTLAAALAEVWGLPTADLTVEPTEPDWVERFDPEVLLEEGWFPLRREGAVRVVATVEEPTDDLLASVARHLGPGPVSFKVVTEWDLLYALRAHFAENVNDRAAFDLDRATPQGTARSARMRPGPAWVVAPLVAVALLALLPGPFTSAIAGIVALLLAAMASVLLAATVTRPLAASDDIPPSAARWTILVPFWHQPDDVPDCIAALRALNHPPERLEILLMFEERDRATLEAAKKLAPPEQFRFLTLPMQAPRTRARALNVGLMVASGDLLAVFDADERPDPAALAVAEAAFAFDGGLLAVRSRTAVAGPGVAVLAGAVTSQVSVPAAERWGLPAALSVGGGFYRVAPLRALFGFDPFSAEPGRDLALRAEAAGWHTGTLPAVSMRTLDAVGVNEEVRLERRGRLQTALTWLRRSNEVESVMGTTRTDLVRVSLLAPLVVGPVVLVALGLLTAQAVAWGLELSTPLSPLLTGSVAATLVAAWLSAMCAAVAAARRGGLKATRALLLGPWWVVQSLKSWRELWRLSRQPASWERPAHRMRYRAAHLDSASRLTQDGAGLAR
jgi:hypothetical protein